MQLVFTALCFKIGVNLFCQTDMHETDDYKNNAETLPVKPSLDTLSSRIESPATVNFLAKSFDLSLVDQL